MKKVEQNKSIILFLDVVHTLKMILYGGVQITCEPTQVSISSLVDTMFYCKDKMRLRIYEYL